MKKTLTKSNIRRTVLVLFSLFLVTLLATGTGLAGNNGQGKSNQLKKGGQGVNAPGLGFSIFDGTPFTLTGTVVTADSEHCFEIDTAEGTIMVYGIGPQVYWEELGVDRPVAGDTLTVEGYIVTFKETERYIAVSITTGDQVVELRDDDGKPLWRKTPSGNGKNCQFDILDGVYFEYTGVVENAALDRGMKITLFVGDQSIDIFGIGPLFYWEELGLSRPVIGETITVAGYSVTCNDSIRNVAAAITFEDGTVVELRDENGLPLWQKRQL